MSGSQTLPWDLAWLLSQVWANLGFVLALVLLAHVLKQRQSPASTIAWLLVIFLLPYAGVPLYLMFGGRKTARMTGKKERVYQPPGCIPESSRFGPAERILRSYGVPPPTSGNAVALVPTGEDAFRQFLELVEGAERTIHITSYILGRDPVGALVVERLARRASEGVAVRVLLDDIGSWWTGRRFLAPLTEAGARVAFFMPMFRLPIRGRANLRNHRKIVLADGRRAMVGGMNLAEHYMGPTPDPKRWRDLAVLVEGPAACDLEDLFLSDWKFATGEDLLRSAGPSPAAAPAPDTLVEVVASGPDVTGDPLYEALISALFTATARVWVVTPYFVPDETLVRALELAARRGVDVRLVVPERSNHLAADLARGSYLRQVHDAGGKVLLFRPVMLHAKLILIDDDLAVIGSANMDIRSLFLNYEVALFLYSRSQTAVCAAWIEALMAGCRTGLPPRGQARELAEDVARLLSPLL